MKRNAAQLSIPDSILGAPKRTGGRLTRRTFSAGMVARAAAAEVAAAIETGAPVAAAVSAGAEMIARMTSRHAKRLTAVQSAQEPARSPNTPAADADPGLQVRGISAAKGRKAKAPKRRTVNDLKDGDTLERDYHGTTVRVRVEDRETGRVYLYKRKAYTSLSAAARAIQDELGASHPRSGAFFFGLAPAFARGAS